MRLRAEAGKYRDLVQSAAATAADVNQKLEELKSRIDAEGARSVAAADLKIAALDKQIKAVQKTVEALATDSQRSRDTLREAESAIAKAREAAQTSEAEFESNAKINVQLVPFDNDLSLKLAAEISASLTQKGFKVSQAPWAGSKGKILQNIQIAHQPIARDKVDNITSIVQADIGNRQLECKVTTKEMPRPISNRSDVHVAIFFR